MVLAKIRQFPSVALFVVLVQIFLLFNAQAIYGDFAPLISEVLTIYLIAFAVVLVALGLTPPTAERPISALLNFIGLFAITTVIVTPFAAFIVESSFEIIILALGFGMLHGFVKAYIEEVIFRFAIPTALGSTPDNPKLSAGVISSVLFGFFHFGVLTATASGLITASILAPDLFWTFVIQNTLILTALGMVWWFIFNRFGLMGSTGSHLAWNLIALGIFVIPIMGA